MKVRQLHPIVEIVIIAVTIAIAWLGFELVRDHYGVFAASATSLSCLVVSLVVLLIKR